MSLFFCQKLDITVISFFRSSGSGKKQHRLTPTKRIYLFISLSGSYPISRVIGFIARGRVQTTWTEFWAILTPPPPMWTLLLNSCY